MPIGHTCAMINVLRFVNLLDVSPAAPVAATLLPRSRPMAEPTEAGARSWKLAAANLTSPPVLGVLLGGQVHGPVDAR